MKKLLSILVSLMLLLTMLPLGAVSVSAGTYGDLSYRIFNGEVTITDCSSTVYGWVFIPDTIEGYPVTAIDDEAFYDCASLTSVTIPSSIKKIGEDAFESITYAPNFTKVYIQDLAAWCAIDFDEYSDVLSGRALYVDDSKVTELVIPDTVTEISDYAFSGCTSIKTVVIGDSVTDIGEGAFEYCSNLQSVTMGSNVAYVQDYAFYTCKSLTDVCLSPSTRSVWDFAFAHCTALKNVCVPLRLTSIDRCAFYDCPALTNVIYAGQQTDRNAISINSEANDDIKNATWHYNNGLTYTFSGGNLTITGVHAAFGGALEIPATIQGYPVTAIGANAFEKTAITSVSLPESITAIETGAFWFCDTLTSITIPASVTSIGSDAFYGCSKLTDVYYGGTVEERANITIGSYNNPLLNATWHYALPKGLVYEIADGEVTITGYTDEIPAELVIPSTIEGYPVTTIGHDAFFECPLTAVTIPDSVTYIGSCAFSYTGIGSIVIPAGVTYIGDDAFHACNCTFEVAANNPNYSALDGILFNKDQTTIVACGMLWAYEYVIPDSVTTIGSFAFFGADIDSLIIPVSVTSIGYAAFATADVTDVYYGGTEEDRANISIGSSNDDLINATWHCAPPAGLLYEIAYGKVTITGYTDALPANVVIPDTIEGYPVTAIGNNAFLECPLASITIPDSVASIGFNAFRDCSSLTSITIPDGVPYIDNYTFSGCSSLTSITIPDSVTSIGWDAYSGCSSLTSITIPNSVTSIKNSAFSNCSSLVSVTLPDSVTSIGSSAFSNCSSLTSATIPDSVTSIGYSAFSNCSSLTSVTIPNGVTSINWGTFTGCSSLISVTIPDSVSSIGSTAFSNCSSLTTVTIPDSVTFIDVYAFQSCSKLTSITIPNGLTSIEKGVFSLCSSLTTITIPNSVTSIGYSAFGGCSSLTSVTIPNSTTSIGDFAFEQCSALTSVTIPDSVTKIGNSAYMWCDHLTDVYYSGTEADQATMTIGSANDYLLNATWHYHEHTYDHDYDMDCNDCGDTREVATPVTFGGNSVSEDVSGLAFKFDVTVKDMNVDITTAIYDNATVGGYKLLKMGAIVTNGISSVDIEAVYLCDLDTAADTASYAVRIINIPEANYGSEITATPYFILEIDGVATTVYGESQTATYNGCTNV